MTKGKADARHGYIELRNGEADRDAALIRVAKNSEDFFPRALAMIQSLGSWKGTGEDLRILISQEVTPHSPNAWGSLVRTALRRGMIEPTGERRRMMVRDSHGRSTDVYART